MKKLLFILIPVLFSACSKKDDAPARIQDIRSTKWVSETTIFSGIGTQAYIHLDFLGGSSANSGDGIYELYDKDSGLQSYLAPFQWSLSGMDITITFKDQNNVQKTQTGAWDTGTLYIEGNYDKTN